VRLTYKYFVDRWKIKLNRFSFLFYFNVA